MVHHPAKLLKMKKIEFEAPEILWYGLGGLQTKNRKHGWPAKIYYLPYQNTWNKVEQTPQLNSFIRELNKSPAVLIKEHV
jgi:hypothetical protein